MRKLFARVFNQKEESFQLDKELIENEIHEIKTIKYKIFEWMEIAATNKNEKLSHVLESILVNLPNLEKETFGEDIILSPSLSNLMLIVPAKECLKNDEYASFLKCFVGSPGFDLEIELSE